MSKIDIPWDDEFGKIIPGLFYTIIISKLFQDRKKTLTKYTMKRQTSPISKAAITGSHDCNLSQLTLFPIFIDSTLLAQAGLHGLFGDFCMIMYLEINIKRDRVYIDNLNLLNS